MSQRRLTRYKFPLKSPRSPSSIAAMSFFSSLASKIGKNAHFPVQPYVLFFTSISLALLFVMTLPGLKSVSLDQLYIYRYTNVNDNSAYYNAYLFNFCEFTVQPGLGTITKTCGPESFNYWLDIGNASTLQFVARDGKVEKRQQAPSPWYTPAPVPPAAAPGPWSDGAGATYISPNLQNTKQLNTNVRLLKGFLIGSCFLVFFSFMITVFLYAKSTDTVGKLWLWTLLLLLGTASLLWLLAVFLVKTRIKAALFHLADNGYNPSYIVMGQSSAQEIVSYIYMGTVIVSWLLVVICAWSEYH